MAPLAQQSHTAHSSMASAVAAQVMREGHDRKSHEIKKDCDEKYKELINKYFFSLDCYPSLRIENCSDVAQQPHGGRGAGQAHQPEHHPRAERRRRRGLGQVR